jgi:DNA-binding transcriptional LysR family regulator
MEKQLGYYLVYQKHRKLTDQMRAFLDWVMDEIADEKTAVV